MGTRVSYTIMYANTHIKYINESKINDTPQESLGIILELHSILAIANLLAQKTYGSVIYVQVNSLRLK